MGDNLTGPGKLYISRLRLQNTWIFGSPVFIFIVLSLNVSNYLQKINFHSHGRFIK